MERQAQGVGEEGRHSRAILALPVKTESMWTTRAEERALDHVRSTGVKETEGAQRETLNSNLLCVCVCVVHSVQSRGSSNTAAVTLVSSARFQQPTDKN